MRNDTLLVACIPAGIGGLMLALACVLPPQHAIALVGGSLLAAGLVRGRMRRDRALRDRRMPGFEAAGTRRPWPWARD